jgi:predicted alpha/beta-fold hydrolase
MVHAARRLNEGGVRTFRMDMRACGAAEGLSRLPYHGGCSHDLFVALQRVAKICPASPMGLVGFSIGGNVALKLAGEAADHLPQQLKRMVVISPPIDLKVCVERLSKGTGRLYDRYLGMTHCRQLRRSVSLVEHAPNIVEAIRPRGQRDFDDRYTSTVWGFETVDQFYAETSSCHVISSVRIPTLLIAARDDQLVPVGLFEPLVESQTSITIHLTDHGGHLGFIGRSGPDLDRRWLDWRIVDAITTDRTSSAAAA